MSFSSNTLVKYTLHIFTTLNILVWVFKFDLLFRGSESVHPRHVSLLYFVIVNLGIFQFKILAENLALERLRTPRKSSPTSPWWVRGRARRRTPRCLLKIRSCRPTRCWRLLETPRLLGMTTLLDL